MTRTIVVGIDGSESSLGALRWAQQAATDDALVKMVAGWTYAIDPVSSVDGIPGPGVPIDVLEQMAQRVLDDAAHAVPAEGTRRQTEVSIGVSDARMAKLMIEVLAARGVDRAFVFYGEEGLDELSIAGPSRIFRLIEGEVTEAEFTPEDFGVTRAPIESLAGGGPAENVSITHAVLSGAPGPRTDAAIVNAAPALVLAGIAEGFVDGVGIARESVGSGAALEAFQRSLTLSEQLSEPST